MLAGALAPAFIWQRDAVVKVGVVLVQGIDDEAIPFTYLPQPINHRIVLRGEPYDGHFTGSIIGQVILKGSRRHVRKELEFRRLADSRNFLGRQGQCMCPQVVGKIVEYLLIRVLGPVAIIRVRDNAGLHRIGTFEPFVAQCIGRFDANGHVLAVGLFNLAA